ncbi:MAG: hypothetical protein V7750_18895 [Sneathiella sp.]
MKVNTMRNSNIPKDQDVPSTGKLIKSTILAAITAGVLLITVVMPSEYGIDPLGVGEITGLKKMGEIKVSLAEDAALERAQTSKAQVEPAAAQEVAKAAPAVEPQTAPLLNHEMQVTLKPDEGTEIKVVMTKGSKTQYTWQTDGGIANFDTHADSKKLDIDYHNYGKGSLQRKEGEIIAAFDGSHGWFWRNRTSKTMTITLQTNGQYTEIKHYK